MTKISNKQLKEYIPKRFWNLPMMETIPDIDFDNNFLCTSRTGSGKSIMLPLVEALLYPEKKIYVRQPSRLATHHLYSAYKEFYGDLIDVGVMTSSLKENEDAQIIFVSDGILSYVFKHGFKDLIIYMDELHQLIPQTEIELALIKKEVKRRKEKWGDEAEPLTRLLTATIDPMQFSEYMMLGDNRFQSDGKFHNIKEEIVQINEQNTVEDCIKNFLTNLEKNNKKGLVFVPTRRETEQYFGDFDTIIDTEFIHAGEDPRKLERIMQDRKDPIAIFSTIVGATSITINVDEVCIIDEKISSIMEQGLMKIRRIPCDNNLLRQMRGRVGRIKEGRVVLCTSRDIKWENIKPTSVELPLESQTPYQIALLMAEYGISDISQLELLSKINLSELKYANDYLKQKNLIESVNGNIGLTKAGLRVLRLPIDISLGIILAKASSEIRPLLTASFCSGYENIWAFMASYKDEKNKLQKFELPEDFYDNDSEFLVKAKIIKEGYEEMDLGENTHEKGKNLKEWCEYNGFDVRRIRGFMNNFELIERYIGKQRDKLKAIDIEKIRKEFIRNILINNTLDRVAFKWSDEWETFSGSHRGFWTLLSDDTAKLLGLKGNFQNVTVIGKVVEIKTKKDKTIRILSCGSIVR